MQRISILSVCTQLDLSVMSKFLCEGTGSVSHCWHTSLFWFPILAAGPYWVPLSMLTGPKDLSGILSMVTTNQPSF